jgi:hypothetical protein
MLDGIIEYTKINPDSRVLYLNQSRKRLSFLYDLLFIINLRTETFYRNTRRYLEEIVFELINSSFDCDRVISVLENNFSLYEQILILTALTNPEELTNQNNAYFIFVFNDEFKKKIIYFQHQNPQTHQKLSKRLEELTKKNILEKIGNSIEIIPLLYLFGLSLNILNLQKLYPIESIIVLIILNILNLSWLSKKEEKYSKIPSN